MKCAGLRVLTYNSISFISGVAEKYGWDEVQAGITSESMVHDHEHGPDFS